jgi:hypothetical protein
MTMTIRHSRVKETPQTCAPIRCGTFITAKAFCEKSREQTGVSAMDTRKLDSLQYRKRLNSGGSPWRQSRPVQEQRQCRKLS